MGGGLMQSYLRGTRYLLKWKSTNYIFKVVYRRHTNFAMESIGQIFNATTDFWQKVSCIIPRNGDLVYKMY